MRQAVRRIEAVSNKQRGPWIGIRWEDKWEMVVV